MKKSVLALFVILTTMFISACKMNNNTSGNTDTSSQIEVVKYKVEFEGNGGLGYMRYVEVEEGSQYTLPSNEFTAPEGKEFSGWKIENEGDLLLEGTNITINSNIDVFAQWKDEVIYEYKIDENLGTATITNIVKKTITEFIFPRDIEGYPITAISDNAFEGCSELTAIIIADGIVSIGERSFYNCSSLQTIFLNEDLVTIGSEAFGGCDSSSKIYYALTSDNKPDGFADNWNGTSEVIWNYGSTLFNYEYESEKKGLGIIGLEDKTLSALRIPSKIDGRNVLYLDKLAFYNCSSLECITIANGIKSIGDETFSNCSNLKIISIPDTNEYIGDSAFNNCSNLMSLFIGKNVNIIGDGITENCRSLTSIVVDEDNIKYDSRDNCNAVIFTFSNKLICGCRTTVIPDTVDIIGVSAFYGNCGAITIPNGVIYIEDNAFASNNFRGNFRGIVIPDSVISLGSSVFEDCEYLETVTLSNALTVIPSYAFRNCYRLTSINIPDSVTIIGHEAFYRCENLPSITLPDGLIYILDRAFSWCRSLTSIVIPDSVTTLGNGAFSSSRLSSIIIGNGVTSIGEFCFSSCSITTIILPDGVTSIGKACFYGCYSLTTIVIPNGVTSIQSQTFYGCSKLESITIPNSVTSIGTWAFEDCSNLKDIYFLGTEEEWNAIQKDGYAGLGSATIHFNS